MLTSWQLLIMGLIERNLGVFPRMQQCTAASGDVFETVRVRIFPDALDRGQLESLRNELPKDTLLYFGNYEYHENPATSYFSEASCELIVVQTSDPLCILQLEKTEALGKNWDTSRLLEELSELELADQSEFEILSADPRSFTAKISYHVEFDCHPKLVDSNPHVYEPSTASGFSPEAKLDLEFPEERQSSAKWSGALFVDGERATTQYPDEEPRGDRCEHQEHDEHCEAAGEVSEALRLFAERLLEFCPDLSCQKGFTPSASALAELLRAGSVNLTFMWPTRSPVGKLQDDPELGEFVSSKEIDAFKKLDVLAEFDALREFDAVKEFDSINN